jgi:hypothetical protein
MKRMLMMAGAAVLAAPVMAEPWGLRATPVECAALESLVVFGLVDGGQDGDTSAFSAVVEAGDGALCQEWLDAYGMGDGMWEGDCREAFALLNANGLPEWLAGEEPAFIMDVLVPPYVGSCADMVFDLTAGQ